MMFPVPSPSPEVQFTGSGLEVSSRVDVKLVPESVVVGVSAVKLIWMSVPSVVIFVCRVIDMVLSEVLSVYDVVGVPPTRTSVTFTFE